jgi:hypothetical protein
LKPASQAGSAVVNALQLGRQFRAALVNVVGMFNHSATAPDFTIIEALLGVQPGQGVTVYNLAVGANSTVQGPSIASFLDGLG